MFFLSSYSEHSGNTRHKKTTACLQNCFVGEVTSLRTRSGIRVYIYSHCTADAREREREKASVAVLLFSTTLDIKEYLRAEFSNTIAIGE